ncbi:acetyltransferase, partial [Vibrio cholerae]
MVTVVVIELSVMRCQPLRRALYDLSEDCILSKEQVIKE